MQKLRKILFPFSWLYGGIVWLRNKFFDWNWISSKSYDFPVIVVGNLSVGGTGKSPMIEYLICLLKKDYRIATLSRGYKRVTKGFYLLAGDEDAIQVGDEPLQFKTKFPEIDVAVDEDRQHGIYELRELENSPEIILLDDAFQHRKVQPGYAIVLTSFDSIYAKDQMLPAGNLREPKSGAKRAQMVVVTKCPENLSSKVRQEIADKLSLQPEQSLYFSFIKYANYLTNRDEVVSFDELPPFSLVTGIAKPEPLVAYLKSKNLDFKHKSFPDHHNFSESEIRELRKEHFILTTEKDFMRLQNQLPKEKLFYLPIEVGFIDQELNFRADIKNYIENSKLKK